MSVTTTVTENPSKTLAKRIVYTPQGKPNLIPFSKDHQPEYNPGRPKGSKSASTVLRELLEEAAPEVLENQAFIKQYAKKLGKKPTIKDALAARLAYQAINKGDIKAAQLIYDRVDGKAAQTVTVIQESPEIDVLRTKILEAAKMLLNADPNDPGARKDAYLLLKGMDEDGFGLAPETWKEAEDWVEGEVVEEGSGE